MKKYINAISARSLILTISGSIALIIGLIIYGISMIIVQNQLTQQMSERWSSEKDVSQVSCFFSPNASVSTDSIEMFRRGLDNALLEASIVQDSPNANARLWIDAYSADGRITMKSNRASVTVDAIGIGGDFFQFHPLQLLYGSYFAESDLNQDRCILDEDAAWQLFGSNNVAGMTIEIGGIPHVIAGVIKRPQGRLVEAAGLDSTLVYVSYTTLSKYGSNNGINHYEVVMPNPVSGYAFDYVKNQIGVAEKEVEIVENSTRFKLFRRFQIIGELAIRSMNGKAIIYPYWENIARGYEDVVALLTLVSAMFLLYPVILSVIFVIAYWRHKTWTLRSVLRLAADQWELQKDKRIQQRKRKDKDEFDDEEELL